MTKPFCGVWTIDPHATVALERKRHPGITPPQVIKLREDMYPVLTDLSLTVTTDNQVILKKHMAGSDAPTTVAVGTWKKDGHVSGHDSRLETGNHRNRN